MEPVLLRARGVPDSRSIDTYMKAGGYTGWRKTLQMKPRTVIRQVSASELRGRGGAGLPTAGKWSAVPQDHPGPRFLICSAGASEPGTFKDREIIEHDPHQVIEGAAIAAYAIKAATAHICIRGAFARWTNILETAIAEARQLGFLGQDIMGSRYSLDIWVHPIGDAAVCGEETSLMESLEGRRGLPRLTPPIPAVEGLFGGPTVVNNAETLACLPHIMERGAAWFAGIGRKGNTGPKLFSVSGHVNRPGVYELPLGVSFREIIEEHGGGIRDGRALKAFFPGGSSSPMLTADEMDVDADFDACAAAGTTLGTGGVIVLDETVDMVEIAANLARFYAHESCGQCTPCREGTGLLADILERILHGRGRPGDTETMLRICRFASGGMTICRLGDAFSLPIAGIINRFSDEFEQRIAAATPPPPRKLPVLPWAGPGKGFGN